jgi:hypothetical protein
VRLGDGGGDGQGSGGGDGQGSGDSGGAGMTRAQWERLLRHKQPKRARVDERDDTQTMTGRESLGPSTRRQFSFDPDPRKQADKLSNEMFTDSSDSDSSDSGDGQEPRREIRRYGSYRNCLYNAGCGRCVIQAIGRAV